MRSTALLMGLFLVTLSGCQCCPAFEHYASAIDTISDHEKHFERLYHPGWDLNRIGRPDWCRAPKNQLLHPGCCDRRRPAPCGFVVCTERIVPPTHSPISTPDWSEDIDSPPAAAEALETDGTEAEGSELVVPPLPELPGVVE